MIDSLLLVLPGLIWGASFLFIAEGLDAVSPSGVAFIRILVGFLTLSVVPAARRPVQRADHARIAVLGVIWMAFPLSMFPFAEQHVSSALAGMLNGAVPLFVAAVAGGIARRAPARPILLGLAVGFLGAILIALPGMPQADGRSGQIIGVLLILAALVSYGFAYSLSGPLQQRNGALPVLDHIVTVVHERQLQSSRSGSYKVALHAPGMQHGSFGDLYLTATTDDARRTALHNLEICEAVTVAFLDKVLKGAKGTLLDDDTRRPEIVVRRY